MRLAADGCQADPGAAAGCVEVYRLLEGREGERRRGAAAASGRNASGGAWDAWGHSASLPATLNLTARGPARRARAVGVGWAWPSRIGG